MNLFDVYPIFKKNIVRGEGSFVYDDKGNKILDFYGGHAVISVGHSHPLFVKAIKSQVERLAFYSNSVENLLQIKLAKLLGKISGYESYRLFLVNSGAEAIENALKLASFLTNKSEVISFTRGFHGRTSAAVHITDNHKISAPINKGFDRHLIEMGDIEGVKSILKQNQIAAIVIEGIQGIGGIYEPDTVFLERLNDLSREYGAVLILDEIQSGYGRTGRFFAHQISKNLEPDLITVAKGMGNGFPIGGVLISPKFNSSYGLLGTTFGGNHLACAAAVSVLEIIESEDLISNAQATGRFLKESVSRLKGVNYVRGRGLMLGLELDYPIKKLRNDLLFKHHLFTGSSADPNTIRLLPPLTVSQQEAEQAVSILKKVLTKP